MYTKLTLLLFLVAVFLTGCPRLAYIDLYNNSEVDLKVNSSGLQHVINPGGSVLFKFTGEYLMVESELENWVYSGLIPDSGYDSEYFDGTLRVQINADGRVYVLKVTEKSPPIPEFLEQPEGFPLFPRQSE